MHHGMIWYGVSILLFPDLIFYAKFFPYLKINLIYCWFILMPPAIYFLSLLSVCVCISF